MPQTTPTASMAAPEPRVLLAGVVAIAFLMHMLGRGLTEAFAVFLLPVQEGLGASRSQVSTAYALFMLVIGCAGPLAGQVFDRLGLRASYCGGLALLGASLLSAGYVSALWQFYLTTGIAAGIGASLLSMVPANAVLSRWFLGRLATVIGIVYAAMGLGVLIAAPVAQLLIERAGWRDTYRLLGAFLLALAVVVSLLPLGRMWRGSADWQARRRQSEETAPAWTLARAARTQAFWAMTAIYFFTSGTAFAVMPQSVACLIEAGIAPLAAASGFGLAGMLSLVGNVGIGVLADRYGRRMLVSISYIGTIIGVVCLLLVSLYRVHWLVYGWVIFFGINQGTRGPVISALVAKLFSGGGFGRIYGTITLGMGGGAAFGTYTSAYLREVTGGYTASFTFAIVSALCGLLTFWIVPALADNRPSVPARPAS